MPCRGGDPSRQGIFITAYRLFQAASAVLKEPYFYYPLILTELYPIRYSSA